MSLKGLALVLAWLENFDSLHVHTHGDQYPSASAVSDPLEAHTSKCMVTISSKGTNLTKRNPLTTHSVEA